MIDKRQMYKDLKPIAEEGAQLMIEYESLIKRGKQIRSTKEFVIIEDENSFVKYFNLVDEWDQLTDRLHYIETRVRKLAEESRLIATVFASFAITHDYNEYYVTMSDGHMSLTKRISTGTKMICRGCPRMWSWEDDAE